MRQKETNREKLRELKTQEINSEKELKLNREQEPKKSKNIFKYYNETKAYGKDVKTGIQYILYIQCKNQNSKHKVMLCLLTNVKMMPKAC